MAEFNQLTMETVQAAVAGTAAAFRCVTEYGPGGGPDAAVFPPTYEGGRYALVGFKRVQPEDAVEADIRVADRVLVDSV